jgi:poly(3-hydroxybutyrate) depolymerase
MRRAPVIKLLIGAVLACVGATVLVFQLGRDTRTLVIDGVERQYDLVDVGEPGPDPVPLVFVFHGRNGSGWAIRRRTGIDEAAEVRGDRAVFVFPQALEYPGEGVVGWQVACDGPDMRFVDAVVRAISAEHAIDRARIFASGFSWGAEMAIAFGCCRHETVRAIAPMSGGTFDTVTDACLTHAPAYRATIGDADPFVPLATVRHITNDLRARHGCSEQTHPSGPHCRAYEGCDAPVVQCVYPGMGHEVPDHGGRDAWRFLRSFR